MTYEPRLAHWKWLWLLPLLLFFSLTLGSHARVDEAYIIDHAVHTFHNPTAPYSNTDDHFGKKLPGIYWNHPPFFRYYLAPIALLPADYRPAAARLALLPFLLFIALAVHLLKRSSLGEIRFAWIATSPLLVILTQAVIWDVAVLGCQLISLCLVAYGTRKRSWVLLLIGSTPLAVATLISYTAILGLIPLVALLWFQKASLRATLLCLMVVALPQVLFQLATYTSSGTTHFETVTTSPEVWSAMAILETSAWVKSLNLLAGLGSLPAMAAFLLLTPYRPVCAVISSVVGTVVGLLSLTYSTFVVIQLILWSSLGFFVLILMGEATVRSLWRASRREIRSNPGLLWWSWFWAVFLFSLFVAPWGTARYLLPCLLPVTYLLVQQWNRYRLGIGAFIASIVVNLVLSGALSFGDFEETQAFASAPQRFEDRGETTFFMSDYGQFEMKRAGFRYLYSQGELHPGDQVIRSVNTETELWIYNPGATAQGAPRLIEAIEVPCRWPFRLSDQQSQAGFWWSGFGILPFSLGTSPLQTFELYSIESFSSFQAKSREMEGNPSQFGLTMARFTNGIPTEVLILKPDNLLMIRFGQGSGELRIGSAVYPDSDLSDVVLDIDIETHPVSVPGSAVRELITPKRLDTNWTVQVTPLNIESGWADLAIQFSSKDLPELDDWVCLDIDLEGPHAPEVLSMRLGSSLNQRTPNVNLPGFASKRGVEVGSNKPGFDYRSIILREPDPALCQSECSADVRCKAWSFVLPGYQGPRATCWLKWRPVDSVPDPCCVSGAIGSAFPE